MPRCLTCGRRWVGSHTGCAERASAAGAAPATPALPLPPLALPGYRLEHTVAQGGFGSVLSARRERDGERVAIKLTHRHGAREAEALHLEAEALRAIGPPTAPQVYEIGHLEAGPAYLVMQYIKHPLLAERLAQPGGALPEREAVRHALALAEALGRVHRQGVVHCDLKPEHVFLDEEAGAVGLLDFGLARVGGAQVGGEGGEAGSAFAGTAEYMAPEQCAGEAGLDARTDVYAAGVILYEMLTGRPPFFGAAMEVLQAHLSRRPPRPSELAAVSGALEEVVLCCLSKERSRRYASAEELAQALRRACGPGVPEPRLCERAPPPSAAAAPSSSHSQRCTVAVLFLRSGANPLALRRALGGCGGQLAFHEGMRFAAVFDPESGENPVRRARGCAERLCAEGVASAAVVDVARVWVQRRTSGPPRYLAALFSRPECYPSEEEPPTLLLTVAAAEALPELEWVPTRQRLFRQALPGGERGEAAVRLARGVLIGRKQELAALEHSARTAVQERAPTLATVVGEQGQGKSHLAAVLLERLQEGHPEAQVLALRAREPVQGEPEATLRLLLGTVLGGPGLERAGGEAAVRARCEALLGPTLARELWPGVACCLGGLAPDAALKSLAAAPGALRALAVRATGELLAARARARPLLLLLDDAHFAEDWALEALEYAAHATPAPPLWVCVLARPSLSRTRPTWGQRAAHRSTLQLGPLALAEALELCRTLLRPVESVPAEALERLAERAQCVPVFVVELVRGLKRLGLVRPRSGGSWYLATDELERLPQMQGVEWLAQRELLALPVELTAYVRLCAVLGSDFSPEEVEGVVSALEQEGGAADLTLDPRHATRRLVGLGVLAGHHQEGLRFRNGLVREVVVRELSPEQRRRLHHAAHRYYARQGERRELLPRRALHAAAAGLREEAAGLYVELAEAARGRHAYLEAESTYSRALELLGEGDMLRQLTVLRGRGLMRYRLGRSEDSLEDFSRARELARRLGQRCEEVELLLDEATALDWANDYPRSGERIRLALALAMEAQVYTPSLQARLLLGMGQVQYREGHWEHARALLEAAAAHATALGDCGYESYVVCLLLLGAIFPHLGRIGDAQRVLEECIAACTERRDRLHLGSALNNRRNLWVALGELPRAVEDQQLFMALGRELGMVGWEYFAEHNLGELYYQAGDMAAAAPHIARAMELERRHPEVAARPWALLLHARALVYEGHEPQARQVLQSIQHVLTERPQVALSASESVLLSLVELATRPASAQEWQSLRVRSEAYSVEQEPLEVLELQALARLRRGERAQAVELLEEALWCAERLPNIMRPRLLRSLQLARGA